MGRRLISKKIAKEKEFDCDIIITDPCYVDYGDRCFSEVDHIQNNTLYGDWSCHVWKANNISECTDDNVIGQFCADAGMVIVANYDQLKKINPEAEKFADEHPWCATVIKGFKGIVQMVQFEYECEYDFEWEPDKHYGHKIGDKYIDDELQLFGKGNINWIGAQTGL